MVPEPSTRRQLLAGGVVIALPLGSGCSALTNAESGTELGQITVDNSDDVSHTIHVIVERDSELVHGSSHDLDAVSEPEDDDDFGSIDGSVLENAEWEDTTGTWTVYTRVDDQTSWKQHEIPTDGEQTCYAVRITIEEDSSVTGFTPDCDSWPPTNES